jgi:hypothetical protein
MLCAQDNSVSAWVNEILARLTVRSVGGIREAAEALHQTAISLGNLRTAACANIASKDPMIDGDGRILASEVFGWREPGERWWDKPRLALTSPLTLAWAFTPSNAILTWRRSTSPISSSAP